MFSANENLALRQHKRRIVQFVEETIPESVLDLGTTVLAMQVSCRAPGCVPLETVVTIIFPPAQEELLPGLEESANGGNFQTKILLPMDQITKDDVLEALPTSFKGGKQSMEILCLKARDVMLAQIEQLAIKKSSKVLMAQYLQQCLIEYMERDCEAPEYGEPFPDLKKASASMETDDLANEVVHRSLEKNQFPQLKVTHPTSGNVVVHRPSDDAEATKASPLTSSAGNQIIHRVADQEHQDVNTKQDLAVPGNVVLPRVVDGKR
jgi:hypothetical protein